MANFADVLIGDEFTYQGVTYRKCDTRHATASLNGNIVVKAFDGLDWCAAEPAITPASAPGAAVRSEDASLSFER